MPWRTTNVMDLRSRFVVEAEAGTASFSELCRRYGVSRPTGYRWVKRFRLVNSFQALVDRSSRPHSSPGRTPDEQESRVLALRKAHGWGARKLAELLAREGRPLPVITVHRILKRHGLIREADRHPPATKRFERAAPNQLWQMDFKGPYACREGTCHPLSILDDHSRFAVGLHALTDQRGAGVHAALARTFKEHGLPEAMLMDRGTPWWSTSNAHGLTWVSVALIKQGIRLYSGAPRHPQTQGKVERFHRTLSDAVRHRGRAGDIDGWRGFLAEFRREYNQVRPHEALKMAVPASRYAPSTRAYEPRPCEWEYPPGSVVRRLNTQGCLDYESRRWFVCEALAGERVRIEEVGGLILITFRNTAIREIDANLGRTRALVLPREKL